MSKTDPSQKFLELGDRSALVCAEADIAETLLTSLKDLGFKSQWSDAEDKALDLIRYTQYNCIVIQETFAGKTLQSNAVMQYLTPLPMAQRRISFVCLIGESFRTLNAMQAFAESVHVVVNPSDLPNLTAILKKSLAEFELQYRVYRFVVDAQGDRRMGSSRSER